MRTCSGGEAAAQVAEERRLRRRGVAAGGAERCPPAPRSTACLRWLFTTALPQHPRLGAQRLQEALVLLGPAHGHPYVVSEAPAGGRAHDDAAPQQAPPQLLRVLADVDEDEVGLAGRHVEAQLGERLGEVRAAGDGLRDAARQPLGVGEGGGPGDDGEAVEIERLLDRVQQPAYALADEGVAEAHAGEAVGLAEGAQHDDVLVPGLEEVQAVGVVGVVDELAVGLVEDHRHALGERGQELLGLAAPHDAAGRVVGAAEPDELGPRRDRRAHRRKVVVEVAQRHRDDTGLHELGRLGVPAVGEVRHHDLVAGVAEQLRDELDDDLRAVTDDHVLGAHAVGLGEHVLEVEEALLGVLPEVVELAADGLQGARRRAPGVLVGGELDQVGEAELALHLLGGVAGDVLLQGEDGVPVAVLAGPTFRGHGRGLTRGAAL